MTVSSTASCTSRRSCSSPQPPPRPRPCPARLRSPPEAQSQGAPAQNGPAWLVCWGAHRARPPAHLSQRHGGGNGVLEEGLVPEGAGGGGGPSRTRLYCHVWANMLHSRCQSPPAAADSPPTEEQPPPPLFPDAAAGAATRVRFRAAHPVRGGKLKRTQSHTAAHSRTQPHRGKADRSHPRGVPPAVLRSARAPAPVTSTPDFRTCTQPRGAKSGY